jgi:predicted enzyme related to lactoylglutathione lyase
VITKVAFIGYPSKDMDAAKTFFGETLGLEASHAYMDKWVEFKTPDGKTVALDGFSPEKVENAPPYLAIEVDDIDAEMARYKEAGVPVLIDTMDNKVCKMAFVADPNGNTICIHQIAPERLENPDAKAPVGDCSS